MVKDAVERKEPVWKIYRFMEAFEEEKGEAKSCIYYSKKEANEQFGRKINQDLDENRKLFWKDVSKVKGENGELQQRAE